MTLLVEVAAAAPPQAAAEPSCFSRLVNEWICGAYLQDRRSELVEAAAKHLGITVVSVLAGLLIAFPLALLARRLPRLEATILGVTTGFYRIPFAGPLSRCSCRSPG